MPEFQVLVLCLVAFVDWVVSFFVLFSFDFSFFHLTGFISQMPSRKHKQINIQHDVDKYYLLMKLKIKYVVSTTSAICLFKSVM